MKRVFFEVRFSESASEEQPSVICELVDDIPGVARPVNVDGLKLPLDQRCRMLYLSRSGVCIWEESKDMLVLHEGRLGHERGDLSRHVLVRLVGRLGRVTLDSGARSRRLRARRRRSEFQTRAAQAEGLHWVILNSMTRSDGDVPTWLLRAAAQHLQRLLAESEQDDLKFMKLQVADWFASGRLVLEAGGAT